MKKAEGILIRRSNVSVKETIDRFEEFLIKRGAIIYARIDQKAEALKAGLDLLPLEYLLFGNPVKGAQLMQTNPLIALDLPLKLIVWTDGEGKTWVAFNDGLFISSRYDMLMDQDSPLNLDPLVSHVLNLVE
jgi:uncharacterized protein (DUF302 family)